MYRKPSKRKQIIQRITVYTVMITAIAALVTVLVFIMLGYQFNRSVGKIEQGGLVQFDSRPNGANVSIDGRMLGTRSPSKSTISAGTHAISIERDGYKAWQKSVEVIPGSILWLNYARLIPNDIAIETALDLAPVSSSAVSPDKKIMAIKENPAEPAIRLVDISQDTIKSRSISLPASSFTAPAAGKPQAFTLENWDSGSRFMLVKHTFNDDQAEWLVVDSENVGATKNVTKLLDVAISTVRFSGENSKILYAQINGDIRKIDLEAATLSRPLATNVAEFSLYDKTTVAYVTHIDPSAKTRSVGYFKDGSEKPVILKTYSDDGRAPLHLVMSRYFNETYVTITYGDAIEIFKGDLPTGVIDSASRSPYAVAALPGGTQHLSATAKNRFITAQQGATYVVYDAELNKTTKTTLKGSTDVTKPVQWLDDYMIWSDRDNMVRFYEFDGTNQHDIMLVVPGYSVSLNPSGKYVYGFVKVNDNLYRLTRARLILP